jgi:hypothetical protein
VKVKVVGVQLPKQIINEYVAKRANGLQDRPLILAEILEFKCPSSTILKASIKRACGLQNRILLINVYIKISPNISKRKIEVKENLYHPTIEQQGIITISLRYQYGFLP